MPWKCEVCTLINADDDGPICDLCGERKGTADPDKGKRPDEKHLSLRAILRAGPDGFANEIKETRRQVALKDVKGVFGIPLNSQAPRVLCDCFAFLRCYGMTTEGLFRIPGQQDVVDHLRDQYEKSDTADVLTQAKAGVNDVATLSKMYFRHLPVPLVYGEHYKHLLSAVRKKNQTKDEMVANVLAAVHALPSPNRECLGMLLEFLREVTTYSSVNKMNAANLATCFAPSLLRAPDDASPQDILMEMSSSIAALNILIKESSEVPGPSSEKIMRNTTFKVPKKARPGISSGTRGNGGSGKSSSNRTSHPRKENHGGSGRRGGEDNMKPPPGMGYHR